VLRAGQLWTEAALPPLRAAAVRQRLLATEAVAVAEVEPPLAVTV
jgi:hypothetical protein